MSRMWKKPQESKEELGELEEEIGAYILIITSALQASSHRD